MPVVILKTGLVTSVGLSAPATCAALRAKLSNPTETHFLDSSGDLIMAHQVVLDKSWTGLTKLVKMATMAIEEALQQIPKSEWSQIPLILCVAEADRPGRLHGLDDAIFQSIEIELGGSFSPQSMIVAHGRVSVAVALTHAKSLVSQSNINHVLIAATDSLITWPALCYYEREERLLSANNSNGFMPGEAAGAMLVGLAEELSNGLLCCGIGYGRELAHLDSGEPLRADGLTQAIKAALADVGYQMHEMNFRITDISGEQYYFKEATLALSRTLRARKEEFDIWHPAECIGETGATVGIAIISLAQAACLKGYAKGQNVLVHMSNDGGQRAAITLQHRTAP